jgi:hypothetical protein
MVQAEVSDKVPSAEFSWAVGLATGILSLFIARLKPWLATICVTPAAIWFISLFLEIHSSDVGPHLKLEQGGSYYLQAYGAFALVVGGLALGCLWHRRKRS